jgi:tagatose-1,6-bisphosphate aldolase non-catalytic subunit AgaZ/GatZ
MKTLALLVMLAALTLALGAKITLAQEKKQQETVRPSAKNTVLLDNEKVKVTESWRKPGDKTEMKERPDRVVYSFKDAKLRYYYPDGKTEEAEQKAGSARYRKRGKDSSENIGKNETHNLIIQLK